ncbi:MAG: mechanosensitive ion channel [Crenarchaeota archaeon]|nr:mechanosensitive ion channel [Thermoproteota archaeon]
MITELLALLESITLLVGAFTITSIVILHVLKNMLPKVLIEETGNRLYKLIRKPLLTSIIMIGIFLSLQNITIIKQYMTYITTVFLMIWTVLGGYITVRTVEAVIDTFHLRLKIPKSSIEVIKKLVKWLILLIVMLVILHILNILKNVIAITMLIIGTLVFLAFAGWSIMGNVTAGIVLMIWKPFKIGDRVEIIPENIVGKVEDITLMFTRIRTEQGDEVYIPNTLLMQKIIKTRIR